MSRNNITPAEVRVASYPYNFSTLREGGLDPILGKTVKWLIDSDDDYIVYVDEDDYVEWTMNWNGMLRGASDLLTRVGWLEAAELEHLEQWQIETYKRLIGEGVARLFEGNYQAASTALDAAERWITARNQEAARVWYLEGMLAGLLVATAMFGVAFWKLDHDMMKLLHERPVVFTAAFLGAVGATLSVLQRSGQTALDIAAGALVQRIEGLARVATGSIGAAFVALLLRSNTVLPGVNASANTSLFLAVCIVAGFSERLVNTLAGSVESTASLSLTKRTEPTGPPPPPQEGPQANAALGKAVGGIAGQPVAPARATTLTRDSATFGAPVPPP